MYEHNYKIKTRRSKDVFLNETFQVSKILQIDLSVNMDPQHDGRAWDDDFVILCESELTSEIMAVLKIKVEEFVKHVNPFGIHGKPQEIKYEI
jgi:hypothetical protein